MNFSKFFVPAPKDDSPVTNVEQVEIIDEMIDEKESEMEEEEEEEQVGLDEPLQRPSASFRFFQQQQQQALAMTSVAAKPNESVLGNLFLLDSDFRKEFYANSRPINSEDLSSIYLKLKENCQK